MYRKIIGAVVVLMMAVVFFGVGLKGCEKKTQAIEAAKPATETPKAPEGYVVVKDEVLDAFVESPGEHFHKARQSFLKKNYKAAAEEIRKSVAFMKLEEARADAEGKKLLTASIDELEKLAKDVEQGSVTSAATLNQAFARAHHALAKHHYLRAMEFKTKEAGVQFGHALKASAIHLEHGFAWAGHEMDAATVAVVKDAGLVAGKLIEGGGWIGKEAGDIIEKIGVEIEKLGKMLEPKKHEAAVQPAKPVKPTEKTGY